MNDTETPQQHYEDPNRPGWCGKCRAAYPCPGSVGNPPPVSKHWPTPGGYTYEGGEGRRLTPEQRAEEVQQLRRECPDWSIWYHRRSGYLEGTYYAKPRNTDDPAATVTASTAHGLRTTIAHHLGEL